MQHDLCRNPNPRSRSAFPFVVILQADLAAEGETRLVAPVAPHVGPLASAVSRALPVIEHHGKRYAVALSLISALPRRQLQQPEASLAHYRDDITRALDWLLWGV
jgi:toxin CcdB